MSYYYQKMNSSIMLLSKLKPFHLMKRGFHITPPKLDKPKKFSPCEKTFLMVKPDGVQRGKIGAIISRFEERGFKLAGIKILSASEQIIRSHYHEHVDKKFFPGLLEYIKSGPVVPMIWEGKNVVEVSRAMVGQTHPMKSNPGTIRGDFCLDLDRNMIHGSSDVQAADYEVKTWFKPGEILDYDMNQYPWVYSESEN
nr:nucleoside diphosphate kinase B-like [Onthophagus taurus]